MDGERRSPLPESRRYKTFARNRSLRLAGFEYGPGYAYFVTIAVRDRAPLLENPSLAGAIKDTLIECRQLHRYAIYAYCLMPDHAHLLVAPAEASSPALPVFVGDLKSLSTRAFWRTGGRGTLWQQHYYDHVLRKEESLGAVGEYILQNPVRRGLTADPRDYRFSGIMDEPPI